MEGGEAPCEDLKRGVGLVRDEQDEESEAEEERDRAEDRHAQAFAVIDALARHINEVAHAHRISKGRAGRYCGGARQRTRQADERGEAGASMTP